VLAVAAVLTVLHLLLLQHLLTLTLSALEELLEPQGQIVG
jgi:hypothetical protein